jgi:RNA polymerase sigma factor (TIGR02999 family)
MPPDATTCLRLAAQGDEFAKSRLLEILYADLRRVAGALLRVERRSHTLQATALVHEAWLRLLRQDPAAIRDRSHFLRLAARAMRQVLCDHARRRLVRLDGESGERAAGEAAARADIDEQDGKRGLVWLLDLDSALAALAQRSPRKAQVVELHFFAGLTLEQVADALETSPPTVDRDWAFARAWLKSQLSAYS